ncbi:MAG TPA: biopolymer transporter ExbD [Hyphomonadaceae bacterium]|jgi:biopolymer transport protein ExbD|nr:biopolymer transporter ExbD [Hyphomonadaceae bacterium]
MAMSAGPAAEGEPMSDINTTPLIDVMLVLLIMLIVTLPPTRHAIKLDTPLPSKEQTPPIPPEAIRLQIDYDGSISWNGSPISLAELDIQLAAQSRKDPQPEIHIEPYRTAKYGVVAHVMASAQRNGLTKLGVMGGT